MANITGTNGDDNSLFGTPGDDVVQMLGGNDYVFVSKGHDLLDGGDGDRDLLYVDGSLIGLTGARSYTLTATHLSDGSGEVDSSFVNIEQVMFVERYAIDDVTIDGSAWVGGLLAMLTGSGDDTLTGSAGGDLFQLYGGGTDLIDGGDGDDNLLVFLAQGGALTTVTDTVDGFVVSQGSDTVTTTDVETLALSNDTGAMNVDASAASIRIEFSSSAQADRIIGGSNMDIFYGDKFSDGQNGAGDVFTGGGGQDMYIFNSFSALNGVVITDFDSEDSLELTALNATFIGTAAFSGTGGAEIRSYAYHGATMIVADTNGDGTGDSVLTLTSGTYTLEAAYPGGELLRIASVVPGPDPAGTTIDGTSGDDMLEGGDGNDVINGLAGNDLIHGDAGDDAINGDEGDDTLHGDDGSDTIHGGADDDTIHGGANTDFLYGDDGNDSLNGGTGDDIMVGGLGDDGYYVDSVGDQVYEADGEGTDTVYTARSSHMLANFVEDLVYTGSGYFTGNGNDQANTITGGAFGNNLDGRGGNDTLYGGALADTLRGANGVDAVYGYAGNDLFYIAEGDVEGGDLFDGGADADRIQYLGVIDFDLSTSTIVDIETLYVDWGTTVTITVAQLEGFSNVDAVVRLADGGTVDLTGISLPKATFYLSNTGTTLDLSQAASAGAGTVHGGDGQDVITGTDGYDTLNGGGDNDVLDGGAGIDSMVGGAGDDTYYVDDLLDWVFENADEGHDHVLTDLGSYVLGGYVEDLTNIGNSYLFFGAGNALDNVMTGSGSMDVLTGGAGTDSLYGNANNDTFMVAEGDLSAGETYDGGADFDTLQYSGTSDLDLSGVTLTDLEALNSNSSVTFSLTVAQVESFASIDARSNVRLVDGGAVDLSGLSLFSQTLTLSDFGNTVDLSTLVAATGAFTVHGGDGQDVITGTDNNDTLNGGDDNDVLDGGAGTDSMAGGAGDDTYYVDDTFDWVFENADEGHDHVLTDLGTYVLGGYVEDLTNIGNSYLFFGYGNALDNVMTGSGSMDVLTGSAGTDSLYGNANNDTLMVAEGDLVAGETYDGGADIDTLQYSGTSDLDLSGVTLTDVEHLASNNFATFSLTIAQVESLESTDARVTVRLADGGAVDLSGLTLYSQALTLSDDGNEVDLSTLVNASAGAFTVNGGAAQDLITGTDNNDTLNGGGGNDVLDGGAGYDSMAGGDGDDTYYVDSMFDTVTEAADEGRDHVITTESSYTLGANLEDLTYAGGSFFGGFGNGLDNVITGSDGADALYGYGGIDSLHGGVGDDSLFLGAGESPDGETFDGGDGYDTLVYSGSGVLDLSLATLTGIEALACSNTVTIKLTVEQLEGLSTITDTGITLQLVDGGAVDVAGLYLANGTLYLSDYGNTVSMSGVNIPFSQPATVHGGDGEDDITGTSRNDTLTGGGGNDVLDGLGGADIMTGGDGGDTYYVNHAGDQVIETDDADYDLVITTLTSYTLGDHVDDLAYYGSANFTGTGNTLGNYIDGDEGNDLLKGLDGADYLTGWDGADTLEGGAGEDALDGGEGADAMSGGADDDVYLVDNAGDTVTELANEGNDTVITLLGAYTLGTNVENLVYLDITGAFTGIGNSLNNIIDASYTDGDVVLRGMQGDDVLSGGYGNDTLYGGAGADLMFGFEGDDTYIVDDATDEVVEGGGCGCGGGGGTDTVRARISYTLDENVENLVLTGTAAIDGTGNELENVLTGNNANNVLDGGEGADVMAGGVGNDTYYVDDVDDVVIDASGTNNVLTSVSFALDAGAVVQTLAVIDAAGTDAIDLTGNEYGNHITGNAGDNVIDGGTGGDRMEGLGGDDTYYVDNAGDVVVEGSDAGDDVVYATAAAFTLGANIEELIYTGTGSFAGTGNGQDNVIEALDASAATLKGMGGEDTLTGGAGNDTLDGGTDADEMTGGLGDDLYIVDSGDDGVNEANGEGTDTVRSSVSFTLSDNVENLTLTGGAASNATGNGLANILIGNGSANVLDGGAGVDRMEGGNGGDTYYVDRSGDVIVEANTVAGGIDTVKASANYTLGAGVAVETLTTTSDAGTTVLRLTGNEFANRIVGNAGGNVLNGMAGNDRLEGLAGNDRLAGGEGADLLIGGSDPDTFVFDTALGGGNVDTITDFAPGADRIELAAAVFDTIGDGFLAGNAFHMGTSATTADHRILYDKTTGNLFYDADGSGAGAAVLFAVLQNKPATLSAGDIYVLGNDEGGVFTSMPVDGWLAMAPDTPQVEWSLSGLI